MYARPEAPDLRAAIRAASLNGKLFDALSETSWYVAVQDVRFAGDDETVRGASRHAP